MLGRRAWVRSKGPKVFTSKVRVREALSSVDRLSWAASKIPGVLGVSYKTILRDWHGWLTCNVEEKVNRPVAKSFNELGDGFRGGDIQLRGFAGQAFEGFTLVDINSMNIITLSEWC